MPNRLANRLTKFLSAIGGRAAIETVLLLLLGDGAPHQAAKKMFASQQQRIASGRLQGRNLAPFGLSRSSALVRPCPSHRLKANTRWAAKPNSADGSSTNSNSSVDSPSESENQEPAAPHHDGNKSPQHPLLRLLEKLRQPGPVLAQLWAKFRPDPLATRIMVVLCAFFAVAGSREMMVARARMAPKEVGCSGVERPPLAKVPPCTGTPHTNTASVCSGTCAYAV